MRTVLVLLAALIGFAASNNSALAGDRYITVASTTSTQNSGLFGHLLPMFEAKTGVEVRVVAVGTGQAIRLAQKGDADVLFVHHRPSEEAFVKDGFGVARHSVMYNDFVIVGPKADPAGVKQTKAVTEALTKINDAGAVFVSRGDDSGTHKKEKGLWKAAGLEPSGAKDPWYRASGSGMGATLNIASGVGGYAMSDRGTWISFKNKGDLEVVFEGDEALFNPYGVILVNKDKHPHVKSEDGQAFIDWLVSTEGQKAIADFTISDQALFTPSAAGS